MKQCSRNTSLRMHSNAQEATAEREKVLKKKCASLTRDATIKSLAKHNITVNCYAPGIVVTQMGELFLHAPRLSI